MARAAGRGSVSQRQAARPAFQAASSRPRYGTFGAPTTFSLPATRHMHEYGTTLEQMAEVSVSTRKWAQMHPKAVMKDDLTVDDVLNSRMVCWPYTLFMCCLVTDAGGALVLTRADEAKALPKPPVYVLGTGHATAHYGISNIRDATTSDAAVISGRSAFDMSGLTHKDIDVAELYDAFSFTPLAALEDLGFVGKGESGPFVENGRTAPGGDFPMNTNGGGLSYSHSGMYGMYTMIEAGAAAAGRGRGTASAGRHVRHRPRPRRHVRRGRHPHRRRRGAVAPPSHAPGLSSWTLVSIGERPPGLAIERW